MSYATLQDLIDRFGEAELIDLTDREDTGAADATVIGRALADADALIDGYVGSRYALPLAEVPPLLTNLACAIARHALYKDDPKEIVVANKESAERTLRDISTGKLALPIGEAETPEPATDSVRIVAPDRVFTADSLKGF